ncbi:MAG TPA: sulfotransferase [Rhizomicrobium sp.]
MIYVVLGMHKSGTTLVSRVLHESGIDMGLFDSTLAYDHGNHFERVETRDLNMAILGTHLGVDSLDLVQPCDSVERHPEIGPAIESLAEGLSHEHVDWGFKDPRSCLTYSVWRRHLPAFRTIIIYRDPSEVVEHYGRQVPRWQFLRHARIRARALLAWTICNRECLRAYREEDCLLLNFREFVSGPEAFAELSAFVQRPLADPRDPRLYRARAAARAGAVPARGPWREAAQIYARLEACRIAQRSAAGAEPFAASSGFKAATAS